MLSQLSAIQQSIVLEKEIEALRQTLYISPDPEFEANVREQIKVLQAKKPQTEENLKKIDALKASIKKKRVPPEQENEINDKIAKLQKESNNFWEYARTLTSRRKVKLNYENLANAIVKQCVYDYEALISQTKSSTAECNLKEIFYFAENTDLTKVDLMGIFNTIKRLREREFVPFAAENTGDIIDEYRQFISNKKGVGTEAYSKTFPYRCAVCGGALKPEFKSQDDDTLIGIGCCGCKTYVYNKEMADYKVKNMAVAL